MGFRFRKSINLPGGVRINASKSGVGYSYGAKGFRVTKTARGSTRTTASIPGTGLSYSEETKRSGGSGPERTPRGCGCLIYVVAIPAILLLAFFMCLLVFRADKEPDIPPTPASSVAPIQSPPTTQPPEKEPSEIAENILLEYLDMEIVDFQPTRMGYQISIEIPGISDRENQEEAPDDWDVTQRLIVSAAAHIRDEFNYSNGIISVSILDSSGDTMVTIQNGRIMDDRYHVDAPVGPSSSLYTDDTIVWISENGSVYHCDPECSGLRNPSPVTRGYAVSHGRVACSRCY